ncbi:hypothetical protein PAXINDRAFT_13567 [Paxillus involutus ATCC 200175]|uniref:Uncharacterized protein n=1 Tax=Paxillus involutus ATCC 200175 TaxID=664439 RepID=A0A0C9SW08_PAXIN|nr:hypothetical protein PAXINDRAFT_13567 [Paxillus involutus ATCC 200175]
MDVPNPLSFFKFDRIPGNFKDATRALTTNTSVWPHTADSPTPGESDIDDRQKTLKQQAEDLRMKRHPWLGSRGLEKAAPRCRHADFYKATLTEETLARFRALIHQLPSHGTAIDFTLSPVQEQGDSFISADGLESNSGAF